MCCRNVKHEIRHERGPGPLCAGKVNLYSPRLYDVESMRMMRGDAASSKRLVDKSNEIVPLPK